jgi:RNAse (barnase) inhibitor barstar
VGRSRPKKNMPNNVPDNLASGQQNDSLANILSNWPRHPDIGRPLKFEETSASTAAVHACNAKTYSKDSKALYRYLTDWLEFENLSPYEAQALWELVTSELGKPLSSESWIHYPAETSAHLKAVIPRRAKKLRAEHRWNGGTPTRKEQNQQKKSPKLFADWVPIAKADEESMSELFRKLGVFSGQWERDRFISEARKILPPLQAEVIALRVRGLEVKDIAKMLEISTSSVRTHMQRARENEAFKLLGAEWGAAL